MRPRQFIRRLVVLVCTVAPLIGLLVWMGFRTVRHALREHESQQEQMLSKLASRIKC